MVPKTKLRTLEKEAIMHDINQQLAIVWAALEAYRADLIPEGDPDYDEQWDDICTAMAVIEEDLQK